MIFKSTSEILQFIKENNIVFVVFKFSDCDGNWRHLARYAESVDVDTFEKGLAFDGSSVPGWKNIERSDLLLKPDIAKSFVSPFPTHATIAFVCDVYDPSTGDPYALSPRTVARKAELFLQQTGLADRAYFGSEVECFVFDDVRFSCQSNESFYRVDSEELFVNSGRSYEHGNNAYRSMPKGGYMKDIPVDGLHNIRAEILDSLHAVGLSPTIHHREVASSQIEVGYKHDTLLNASDNLVMCKYVIRNTVAAYGKTATFMPKPIKDDNGSGMHVHQSLWKGSSNIFAGDKYAGLSETAIYYIGGILKHLPALCAFANPRVNSYKRLVRGFEAPVAIAYSYSNRSAAIRVPAVVGNAHNEARFECRFPDPTANPYYLNSAMLLAGLDGIMNKIDPGKPHEVNLYESNAVDILPHSLHESLSFLDSDRSFLTANGVFTDEQIDTYLNMKLNYLDELINWPTPAEFVYDYNA